jgi:triosephosphate isomerase
MSSQAAQKALRKVVVGGNWKSNGSLDFIKTFVPQVLNQMKFDQNKCDVVVCPTPIHMSLVKSLISDNFKVSSQNVSMHCSGAYTGEFSAKMLKDAGFDWTLTGHSERRQFFGDTSEIVGIKTSQSVKNNLNAIACIGENLNERNENRTIQVCIDQLLPILKHVQDENLWKNIVIAYEPVWAIGTGKTASPDQAQEVHFELREWIRKNVSAKVADEIRIIYGGSVTEKNAKDLIVKQDIDGFLVGGASLKPGFKDIIDSHVLKC